VSADPAAGTAGQDGAIAGDAVPDAIDAAELLDVDVQPLARPLAKRRRHLRMVVGSTPNAAATAVTVQPSSRRRIIGCRPER
jgi:hypothetical protein